MIEFCPQCKRVYYDTLSHECAACNVELKEMVFRPTRAAELRVQPSGMGGSIPLPEDGTSEEYLALLFHAYDACTSAYEVINGRDHILDNEEMYVCDLIEEFKEMMFPIIERAKFPTNESNLIPTPHPGG